MPLTNRGLQELGAGNAIWTSANIDFVLFTTAATLTPDVNFMSEVSANEVSVGGYARQNIANPSITEDDANDQVEFDCDDVTFSSLVAGETVGYVGWMRQVTNDTDSPLLGYIAVTNTPTNGGNITIQWNADGVFTLTST